VTVVARVTATRGTLPITVDLTLSGTRDTAPVGPVTGTITIDVLNTPFEYGFTLTEEGSYSLTIDFVARNPFGEVVDSGSLSLDAGWAPEITVEVVV